jgi:hypothetical protein
MSSCRCCQSTHQRTFTSEIAIHFPGIENLDQGAVFAFPVLYVCLDCGHTEFLLERGDLRRLIEGGAANHIGLHSNSRQPAR